MPCAALLVAAMVARLSLAWVCGTECGAETSVTRGTRIVPEESGGKDGHCLWCGHTCDMGRMHDEACALMGCPATGL